MYKKQGGKNIWFYVHRFLWPNEGRLKKQGKVKWDNSAPYSHSMEVFILDNMMSKSWQNFQFWVNYHFKLTVCQFKVIVRL